MLRRLSLRDFVIVPALELEFHTGFSVLTGETGAGKSILLDALGFVLGWRGRAELVRQGAAQGEVTAVFDLGPGHPARAVLDEAGIEAEDELILRRVNTVDGRKTAWVNDRRVSGEVLRDLGATVVIVPAAGATPQRAVPTIDNALWNATMLAPHATREPWGTGVPTEADLIDFAREDEFFRRDEFEAELGHDGVRVSANGE